MESQDLTDARQEGAMDVGKTLGLIPMFILILIIVLRISWVLYRSTLLMAVEFIELICVILVPIVTYLLYLLTFMIFYWTKLLRSKVAEAMDSFLLIFLPSMVTAILLGCVCTKYVAILVCGQKTRTSQQRRVYVGSRTRRLSAQEPSIYVSPANLPPPPKYEAMAPPSYDEVMGVQYPSYQRQQPITHPLTHALAQSTSTADTNVTIVNENTSPATLPSVVTVTTDERRTSVTVRS